MKTWGIILAAGKGSRLQETLRPGQLKQFLPLKGKPLFWHGAKALAGLPELLGLVFVFPENELKDAADLLRELDAADRLGLPWLAVKGGAERQDSVMCAIRSLPPDCDVVLIHDGARPFADTALARRVLDGVNDYPGVVPGIALADTVKRVDGSGEVAQTMPRQELRAVQTPQAFRLEALFQAHSEAARKGLLATDDAALLEACGLPVLVVEGDPANKKITTPEDLALLEEAGTSTIFSSGMKMRPCIGFGYDVHRYGGKRPFILGGVTLRTGLTVDAHSDGDTLLHALMDALLGCIGAGDIGMYFPDSDERFDNMSSSLLLAEVLEKTRAAGLEIMNVDLTVVAQEPRISPVRAEIVKKIAKLLQIPEQFVNLKGTTEERLGFTGEKKGIKAIAAVMGLRPFTL